MKHGDRIPIEFIKSLGYSLVKSNIVHDDNYTYVAVGQKCLGTDDYWAGRWINSENDAGQTVRPSWCLVRRRKPEPRCIHPGEDRSKCFICRPMSEWLK